jgi:uncharacterized protein DUF6502
MRKPASISSPKPSSSSSPIQSLAHAMMPLTQLCLRSGLGAGDLISALKMAFVRSCATEVISSGRLNYSRIAAMSGLTRKEVRQLLQHNEPSSGLSPQNPSRQRTARVIHGWRTDPQYLDEAGGPAILPISSDQVSFYSLVKRYGGDVTPVSVLKELERTGSIKRLEPSSISLRKASVRMKGYNNEALVEASLRLHDLGTSFLKGLESPDAPVFHGFQELKVDSTDAAALFQKTFAERGASLLAGVERWIGSQARIRHRKPLERDLKTRVGIGVYLVNELNSIADSKGRSGAAERQRNKKERKTT